MKYTTYRMANMYSWFYLYEVQKGPNGMLGLGKKNVQLLFS